MRVALVNTNRSRPPVAPIGLEYVAAAVHAAGHEVAVLDLCWETEWEPALRRFLEGAPFGLVGLTLRNTDDCMMSGGRCFLPEFAAMARAARSATEALLVVGGVGF